MNCTKRHIVSVSLGLAEEIKNILRTKEKLKPKDNQIPTLETYPTGSTEIWMWAIAILSSAWIQWCFTAKTNNSEYQNDPAHHEASENVKLALPYVKTSISDAILRGQEIGSRDTGNVNTAFVLNQDLLTWNCEKNYMILRCVSGGQNTFSV